MANSGQKVFDVSIARMGQFGQGVAYLPDGRILFVEGALPEERVQALVTAEKSRYAVGRILEIAEPSAQRIASLCPFSEDCGGCSFQHWNYPEELRYKENWVRQALVRIGKLPNPPVHAIMAAASPLEYRNKGQFPWSEVHGLLQLGLYARGSHHLIPLDHCIIENAQINEVLKGAPPLARARNLTAYDEATGQGVLRHLLIRSSLLTSEVLVLIVAARGDAGLQGLARDLMDCCPQVKGVGVSINAERTNRILGKSCELLAGRSTIIDSILDMSFQMSFESFFQVNPLQVSTLYRLALEQVPEGTRTLWDLYSGVGTLSSLVSRKARDVYAIEVNAAASRDALDNYALNHLHNVHALVGRVEDVVDHGGLPVPDVVLMDPPRKGVESSVVDKLLSLKPPMIIYISCNPDTLARDIARLNPRYRLQSVTPVDMFPRTDHVESVSVLTRRD